MDARETLATELAARSSVTLKDGVWIVPSQSEQGKKYNVILDGDSGPHCSCPDFELRRRPCKHILAARLVRDREEAGEPAPTPTPPPPVRRPRPTYKQVWPAYNAAQTHEKELFQSLLSDLCSGLVDPPQTRGRPRTPLCDAVFAACFKVYLTFSARRSATDFREAAEKGYIRKAPHFNTVLNCLEDPTLTPTLQTLIAESAKPLASVEVDFAADSSAFTSNKFARWFDVKHNKVKDYHVWQKIQMMCGVKTNVVTAAVVCEQDGPDSPYLPQLTQDTAGWDPSGISEFKSTAVVLHRRQTLSNSSCSIPNGPRRIPTRDPATASNTPLLSRSLICF